MLGMRKKAAERIRRNTEIRPEEKLRTFSISAGKNKVEILPDDAIVHSFA